MSIVNASQVIKKARLKAKLTQQDLADGISYYPKKLVIKKL